MPLPTDDADRAFEAGDFARLRRIAVSDADPAVAAHAKAMLARAGFGRAEVAFFSLCALTFIVIAFAYYGAK